MKISTTTPRKSILQRSPWLSFCFMIMMLLGSLMGSAQLSLNTDGVAVIENFNSMASAATATLPAGFKIGTDWSSGTTATTLAYGTSGTGIVTGTSSGGAINWANGVTASSTDRSLGFLNTGTYTSPKSIVLKITNNTGLTITDLAVSFDYEKSRSGSRQFDWTFFHGTTTTPATSATGGNQTYLADANNTVISNPPLTTSKSFNIAGLSIAAGTDYYFKWTFTGLLGSTNGQGIGIDNFSVTPSGLITAPTVTTTTATSITSTGASSGGNVTSNGGDPVTARGVAYGLSPNPTTAGSITSDGTGSGVFVSTLSGLDVNTQYFYRAYATNSLGTSYGSESNFYTLANTPGTVTVNNPTTASLDVTLAGGDGSPASTEYAIQETGSGNYIQAGGALGASPVWQTAATWGTKTVTGLAVNANYSFHAKARNAVNVETAFGGSASLYTLANTPGAPTVNNPTASSLDVTLTLNGNPGITQFAIQETTTGNYVQTDGSLAALFVWQTASNWGTKTVTGLTASTLYTFQVKARNDNNVETGFGATQNGSTIAANQPDLTETSLASFGAVCINTTTVAHTFTINGTDLTTDDVTVGPLSGFSFSTDDITYTASLSISQPGGAFSQLIYVKFSPTSAISYDGNIPVGGGGALSDNVAASGSGLNTAPTVTTGAATNVTINSATIPGTITAEGCSAITAYGAEYSITSGFANGTGIQFAGNNLNAGAFTVDINVLNSGTQYYYHTYATNGGGTSYSSQGTFTTLTPVLSTDALTAFGPVCTNTTTAANTFTITGTNLSTADVTVATLNGYSYSTDDVNYFPSLTISQPGGSFSQLIYVKFSPTLVQSYNGNIVVGGGGAANSNVAASGSGINSAPSVTTGGSSAVTQTSATLNGAITNNGCTAISAYGIEYSTLNGFVNGTGTAVAGGALTLGAYSSPVGSLNPGVTYYYKAYATNDAGTSYGSQSSFTTSALDAPIATAATGNTTNSFTANWNAVAGASSYRLDVSTLPNFGTTITATDLFISEYVEGSATNKYLEIYNGTGASVNLTDYKLRLYSNGSSTPVELTLSGTLANGATIVYKNSAATIYGGTATVANTVINYNGDDAVVLFKISANAPVDIFGRIGEDPGVAWTGGGNSTLDKTLVRKPTVTAGVTVNPAAGFPTLATEWTQSNVDVVTNLGTHSFNSFNPSFVSGYNDLTVNGLFQSVTGLTANTTYYYRVRAFSATSTSANSNTITTQTLCAAVTASAGANGTISPAGVSSYNCGDNAAFTITPDPCYSITDVIADGISQGPVGSYTFTGITAGEHTISATFAVSAPLTAPTVTGPVNVCPYLGTGEQVTYTFNSPGATSYSYSIPPTNVTLVSSTANSITVTFASAFKFNGNKQIRVTGLSSCGNSPQTVFVLVAQTPNTPQPITGPTSVCPIIGTPATFTYTIPSVVGATSYIWTAQAGTTTITHPNGPGPNDTTVNISFTNGFTSSNLTAAAANDGCGASNLRSLALTKVNASTPGLIAGPTNVCPHIAPNGTPANYSVSAVVGQTYNWTVPAAAIGLTGQGTASISFTYPAGYTSGTISVTATNGCGTSGSRTLNVSKLNPATPSGIDVIEAQPCPNRIYTYSVSALPANAVSVQWTVPAAATGFTGQGTTTITVTYPATAVIGSVTATAVNNCGSSATRTVSVKLPACAGDPPPPGPRTAAKGTSVTGATTATETIKVNVFPNPTVSDFKLQVITAGKEAIRVRVLDMQGRELKSLLVNANQTINIGSDLRTGSYIMEVKQGTGVKTVKVIKF
ncbi:MAG: lamin tail domain-containing protein [Ferruginibacter sp.]